ncbi:MAG: zinc ribbon domain-containing protein [Candidatus Micrarchaeota archaeon]|nr:zinc ribbon domain-containing protein [Candidatus Micrarchaeota archaeon]
MVKCHKCGAENSDNAKYCSQCGTDIVKRTIRCPRCGSENRHDAKYCNECGRSLAIARDWASALGEALANLKTVALAAITMLLLAFIVFLMFGRSGVQGGVVYTTTGPTISSTITTTIIPRILNPANGMNYSENVEYNSNTMLYGSVATAGNITIDKGVVLTTNGFNLISGGTFNNMGSLVAGNPGDNAGLGVNGTSYYSSYGGSGGSGGGGGGNAQPGATAHAPKLTASLVSIWYSNRIGSYLTGAGGGGGCPNKGHAGYGGDTTVPGGTYTNINVLCTGSGGKGGSGSYGVYVQANKIDAGTITAQGQQGSAGPTDGGGAGGGGVILLAYGSGGYTQGTYNVTGGASQQDGAAGGNGLVLVLNYTPSSRPPVRVP